MRTAEGAARSRKRVVLELAAFGVLVLLAVVWARRSVGVITEETTGVGEDRPVESIEPQVDSDAGPDSAPSLATIPPDPEAWRAMTAADVAAVGRSIADRMSRFRFDRVEEFGAGEVRNVVAVLVHHATGLEFSLIPPGRFSMGSPTAEAGRRRNEGPAHDVTITRPFLLARTECTRGAWSLGRLSDEGPAPDARAPAIGYDWDRVNAWCRQFGLRLPREAEWEYAARAGTTTRYWSGDEEADLARVDWYCANSDGYLHCVAEKPANPFGLHDVHGNVWEWCADVLRPYHGGSIARSSWYPGNQQERVVRGASFDDAAWNARSAFRYARPQDYRLSKLGFRPAKSIPVE